MADAYEACFQEGLNPTDVAVAKKMNVARETVNRWRRRNPSLWAWVRDRLEDSAESMKPLVDRRVTHLAIQGSVDHAKLFYQFVGRLGVPAGEGVLPSGMQPGSGGMFAGATVNILVPRPQMAQPGILPQPGVVTLPPPVAAKPAIPTVSVR